MFYMDITLKDPEEIEMQKQSYDFSEILKLRYFYLVLPFQILQLLKRGPLFWINKFSHVLIILRYL